MDNEIPEVLYKYRDWEDEHHKDMIRKGEIFFTSSVRLNDPFDCVIRPRTESLNNRNIREFINIFLSKKNLELNSEEIIALKDDLNLRDKNSILQIIRKTFENMEEEKKQDSGIFTLSKIRDNILMWSHYSNFHKGFCIGLNSKKLNCFFEDFRREEGVIIDLHKVEYSPKYPFINPMDIENRKFWLSQFKIKSIDWAYEKEWRYILTKATDLRIYLDFDIFQEVIFGCRMPHSYKEEIINLVKKWPSQPKIYQAIQKDYEFGLSFEKIDC